VFGPGAKPSVVYNDDGSVEVTAGKVPTPGGLAEATVRIDRDRLGASAEVVLPDGRTWSQIDTIRNPQGTVVGTQTTTFDGTRVTQTWAPAELPLEERRGQAALGRACRRSTRDHCSAGKASGSRSLSRDGSAAQAWRSEFSDRREFSDMQVSENVDQKSLPIKGLDFPTPISRHSGVVKSRGRRPWARTASCAWCRASA